MALTVWKSFPPPPLFPFRDSVVEAAAAAAALIANQDFDPAGFNEPMAAAADATGVVGGPGLGHVAAEPRCQCPTKFAWFLRP